MPWPWVARSLKTVLLLWLRLGWTLLRPGLLPLMMPLVSLCLDARGRQRDPCMLMVSLSCVLQVGARGLGCHHWTLATPAWSASVIGAGSVVGKCVAAGSLSKHGGKLQRGRGWRLDLVAWRETNRGDLEGREKRSQRNTRPTPPNTPNANPATQPISRHATLPALPTSQPNASAILPQHTHNTLLAK